LDLEKVEAGKTHPATINLPCIFTVQFNARHLFIRILYSKQSLRPLFLQWTFFYVEWKKLPQPHLVWLAIHEQIARQEEKHGGNYSAP
jgi:hypothetical protein